MHANNERQLLARIAELEAQQKNLTAALTGLLNCAELNQDSLEGDTHYMIELACTHLAQLNAP